MAKGQKKSNREAKKPKASKKTIVTAAEMRNPATAKFNALKASK